MQPDQRPTREKLHNSMGFGARCRLLLAFCAALAVVFGVVNVFIEVRLPVNAAEPEPPSYADTQVQAEDPAAATPNPDPTTAATEPVPSVVPPSAIATPPVPRTGSTPLATSTPSVTKPVTTPKPVTNSPAPKAPPTPAPAVDSKGGQGITILGDSVTVMAQPALKKLLPGAYIQAKVSAQLWDAPKKLRALAAANQLGDVVVIALGTNGIAGSGTWKEIWDAIGTKRKVVLVTPHAPDSWIPKVISQYREFAAKNPGQIVLADWEAVSPTVTDFARDGVHPGSKGAKIFAETIARAVARARQ